jgi:hypothetical protein
MPPWLVVSVSGADAMSLLQPQNPHQELSQWLRIRSLQQKTQFFFASLELPKQNSRIKYSSWLLVLLLAVPPEILKSTSVALASANSNLFRMAREIEESSKPECRFKFAEQAHPSPIPARTEKWGVWSKSQGPRRIAPEKSPNQDQEPRVRKYRASNTRSH